MSPLFYQFLHIRMILGDLGYRIIGLMIGPACRPHVRNTVR